MKRIAVFVMMAACSGGTKPQPAGGGGPGSGQAPGTAKGSPIEEGCKAYAARCPNDEGNAQCVENYGPASEKYKTCRDAGKLDAYTQCLVGDCFKTVKCDEGVSMCFACTSIAQCDAGP